MFKKKTSLSLCTFILKELEDRFQLLTPLIWRKVVSALLGARGKDLRSDRRLRNLLKKFCLFTGSTFGGNTPCVRVDTSSNDWLIFDGGSGLRVLGNGMANGLSNQTFHLFMSISL